jgi:hypothetical protein
MTTMRTFKRWLVILLAAIGAGTVLFLAGRIALHALRNRAPDSLAELPSPDRRYRIVVTEVLAGFPGATCIKQVYVLPAHVAFDRNDEDDEVYEGACDGLTDLRWDGNRVRGNVALDKAAYGVAVVRLRAYAANGEVRLGWSGD